MYQVFGRDNIPVINPFPAPNARLKAGDIVGGSPLYGSSANKLSKLAGAAGWENKWGDTWVNSSKPGQYLSSANVMSLLEKQSSAKSMSDAGSYNPGVNYQSVISPYLSQAQAQGGASSVSQNNEYANKLKALMANPDSIQNTGAYQFQYNQGQQALERSAAAKGMSGSGNVLAELMRYGQGQASQAYDTEANRLAGLAGNENQFILGKMVAANTESATKSQSNALLANLALNASKAQSDDYWNANKLASDNAFKTGYITPNIW